LPLRKIIAAIIITGITLQSLQPSTKKTRLQQVFKIALPQFRGPGMR